MGDIENLELNKEYIFAVRVHDGENRFAGHLELSPEKVTLTVKGEVTEDRKCSFGLSDIDEVWCDAYTKSYILKNLKAIRTESGVLEYNKNGFFEHVYEVAYLVYFTGIVYERQQFRGFSVDFEEAKSWIAHTNTQEKILKHYAEKKLFNDKGFDPTQFTTSLQGIGRIILKYNVSAYHSASDFSSGVHFPPSLHLLLSEEKPLDYLKELYDRLYNLMSFIIGNDISVTNLKIAFNTTMYSTMKASLYYPHTKYCHQRKSKYPLYPLGRDLRFDSFGYPEFDISSFGRFFSLDKDDSSKWKKYRKYRDMNSIEERFLGYFRLLESLVYKSKNYVDEEILNSLIDKFRPCVIKRFNDKKSVNSFLRGLPRYNDSKYNTQKCIGDFYKTIPAEIREKWIFSNNDIGGICKLRNDITHANDYHESDSSLYKKSIFIETLLVFALYEKLGIPSDKVAPIIHRLDGYDHIKNRQ
ncbi:HEPN domain-containing protein [Microbulbifer epialgicus]|uniref:HEPN domain-containing protein n=1 Tax=Microbulbifer epialgicus TaxID=393907 RepID=A0ABV4NY45_9GAMM